jgi:hypothetical protein
MTPQHKSLLLKLLPLIIGISVILAGAVSYWAYQSSLHSNEYLSEAEETGNAEVARVEKLISTYANEGVPEVADVPEREDPLNYGLDEDVPNTSVSGLIILSGQEKKPTSEMQFMALDVSSSTAQPGVYNADHTLSVMAEFDNPNNPSGYFFLGNLPGGGLGISYHDNGTNELGFYENTAGLSTRNIDWSQSTKLLAYDRTKEGVGRDYVDYIQKISKEVVIYKPDTEETVLIIPGAVQPQWLPDGESLIYMKRDGLYLHTIDSKQERILWKVAEGGIAPGITMINLSPDGKYLAWTTAKKGVISMFEVVSGDEDSIELDELGRISLPDTEVYWPQFSPDGNYYAVQAIDTFVEPYIPRKNARIEIRPTKGREVVYTHPLDRFDFNQFFTDDWIVNSQ